MTVRFPRRSILGFLLGLTATAARAQQPCPAPRVLFVCPAGTVKSAIARETLKQQARKRGLAVDVQSRGIDPQDHVSPLLADSLKRDGIDPKAEPVRAFSPGDVQGKDIVVAFDEAAQAPALQSARTWNIPSWNDHYPEAKAALATQVASLLGELSRRGCSGGR